MAQGTMPLKPARRSASLRRSFCSSLGTDHGDRATGPGDRLGGRFRHAGHLEGETRRQLANAEDLHAVARLRDHASRHQRLVRHGRTGFDVPGGDRLLDPPQIDLVELALVRRREAALRQAPMEGHLTALEALDGHAGAGLLTLHAAPARLALAGADAPADAHTVLGRAVVIANVVEFHDDLLSARPRTE